MLDHVQTNHWASHVLTATRETIDLLGNRTGEAVRCGAHCRVNFIYTFDPSTEVKEVDRGHSLWAEYCSAVPGSASTQKRMDETCQSSEFKPYHDPHDSHTYPW